MKETPVPVQLLPSEIRFLEQFLENQKRDLEDDIGRRGHLFQQKKLDTVKRILESLKNA